MSRIKELQGMLSTGRINRRDFMAGAAALGVSTALSSTMAGSAMAAPKKGGHLRMGVAGGATTDSLDPATTTDTMASSLNMIMRNCLTEVGPDGNLTPELASEWSASADATTWTFKLRDGVEFHNGKTMDAEDVVFSLNHHRGEDSKSAAKGIVDPIESIEAKGKDTVVVSLKGGNADFPFIVSDYHLQIMPAGTSLADMESAVGTGGYMLESHEPGVRAVMKRNPNYWKEGRAHFDSVEYIGISDANARTNALKTGEIDVMNRVDLKTVHLMKRLPGVKIHQANGTKHYTIPMDTRLAPYSDNNVRMALKHSINREEVVKKILKGYGVVGNDHPIAPSNRFHAKDLPQRPYDPEKAKWYLKQAGMDSLQVNLSAADAAFGGAVDAAVLYKEHAAAAGINVNVVREPNDGYWSNVWMKKEWCMCYWSGRPTEDWMFATAYAEDASWNDAFWKNDKFNQLLKAARAELNEDTRRTMYYDMQEIVSNDGGTVVPMFASDLHAYSDKLAHGDNVGANWEFDGMKLAERWWFA